MWPATFKTIEMLWISRVVKGLLLVNMWFCHASPDLWGFYTAIHWCSSVHPPCSVAYCVLYCWSVCLLQQSPYAGTEYKEKTPWYTYLIYRNLCGLNLQVLESLSFLMFKHHHFSPKDYIDRIWESNIPCAEWIAIIKEIWKGYRKVSNTYLTWP